MNVMSIQLVSSYQIDKEITLTCGQELKGLEKELKGKLFLPSVPDSAPPEAPRAILKTNDSILAIGWNRIELNVTPPSHIASNFDGCLGFLQARMSQIFPRLLSTINGYQWSGVIVNLNYPSKGFSSHAEAAAPLFDEIIKVDRKGRPLTAFQLQFGYEERNLNHLFIVSGYEARDLKLPQLQQNQTICVDLEKIPVVETGIKVGIDINNKRAQGKTDWQVDVNNIISAQKEVFGNIGEILHFEGVLK